MLPNRWGSNSQPPDHQSNWATKPFSDVILMCTNNLTLVQIITQIGPWFTILLLNMTCPVLAIIANSVDPDQLASEEANWSGSALFAIKYVNL